MLLIIHVLNTQWFSLFLFGKEAPERYHCLLKCLVICTNISAYILSTKQHLSTWWPLTPWPEVIEQYQNSYNALDPYPAIHHSEQKCAHFCSGWWNVGYGSSALWDLWDCSIEPVVVSQYQAAGVTKEHTMPSRYNVSSENERWLITHPWKCLSHYNVLCNTLLCRDVTGHDCSLKFCIITWKLEATRIKHIFYYKMYTKTHAHIHILIVTYTYI